MISVICYALFYLMETITCYIFFENLYRRKKAPDYWNYRAQVMYPLLWAVNYAFSYFGIPMLNLTVFVITTFTLAIVCYEIKVRTAIYLTGVLAAFMLLSELMVTFFSSSVFNVDIDAYENNFLLLIVQASISKLIYFLVAYLVCHLFKKRGTYPKTEKYVFSLALLPFASLGILLLNSGFMYNDGREYNSLVSVSAVLLIISNVIVFTVYDFVQRTNNDNIFLQLEQQKNTARLEYYEMLMSQYENRNILVHDIKHHLIKMENYALNGESDEIAKYIDLIRDEFGLGETIEYSGNRMIDAIVNRYKNLCRQNGIEFLTQVQNIPADFMNEVDLTALLDNMLENAMESADRSEKKYVHFSASRVNDNFLNINVRNSCDTTPEFDKNGYPVSTKSGKGHGWGTKSMIKVLKKYDGDISYSYNKNEKEFECEIVLKH